MNGYYKLNEVVEELMDFLEDNNICDINEIEWITDEDCYVESKRSPEMIEILQKVVDALKDDLKDNG